MAEETALAVAERTLARLVRWKPRGPAEGIREQEAKLRSAAEQVRELQARERATEQSYAATRLAARAETVQAARAEAATRKAREPGRKAVRMLLDFGHPELRGRGLSSALLSPDEGKELLALVEARIGGELSGRKLGRYRKLVGKAAGDPDLFDKARAEREAAEAEAAEAERVRLAAIPERSYRGRGGCYLPSYLFGWLTDNRDGSFTVTDLGVLALIWLAIEQGEPVFVGAEMIDGAIVLDGAHGFQLRAGIGDDCTGASRIRDSVRYLADNDWLTITPGAGQTRIELGPRARKLIDAAVTP